MNTNFKLVGALLLLIKLAATQQCGPDQFQCDNGRCIPTKWLCDLYNDCGDNSDEPGNREDCPPCDSEREWQCENGQCIRRSALCDGSSQCEDNSDEPEDPAQCPECIGGEFRCSNGRCINLREACNDRDDCGDGSDEELEGDQCPDCAFFEYKCRNGRCVGATSICDGTSDCKDGSDELIEETGKCPPCPDLFITCNTTGRCITETSLCNGNNNCGDWSDETEEACPCGDNETRCPAITPTPPRGNCIPEEFWCDAEDIWDCPDGADQINCTLPEITSGIRN